MGYGAETVKRTGDLTDNQSWERAWRRSRRRSGRSFLKSRLVENHHDTLRMILARANGPQPVPLHVVELGCAPGNLLAAMAAVGPEHAYSGVDFAAEALERTATTLAARGLHPQLYLADIREFEPARHYDLVVSFGLIEHFQDPREILSHHVRLARPGGLVAVTLPNYSHPLLYRTLAQFSPDTLHSHNIETMDLARLRWLFDQVGLVDVATGNYGRAVIPGARVPEHWTGTSFRVLASLWNIAFRSLPARLSPWQGYLWAAGRREG